MSKNLTEPLAKTKKKPTRAEAEDAVRTLIEWTGENPDRDGLLGTPDRVVRAYEEFFAGYNEDPQSLLAKTFENISGYDELIVLKDIRLESHCEHHIVPIIGKAHIGYLPNERVVGISKLVRLVDIFAKRCRFRRHSHPKSQIQSKKYLSQKELVLLSRPPINV